jgi:6-phosphogluconate dehydrogenase
MILDAAEEYSWDIDLGEVAKIWRGGCIIRAAFLDRIRAAYAEDPDLVSLLSDKGFAAEITDAQVPWREVVAIATRRGVPAPAFSAALSYYDSLRAERLPAALTQGQRDYFGAHTYLRTDREGSFHTLWGEEGRAETEA